MFKNRSLLPVIFSVLALPCVLCASFGNDGEYTVENIKKIVRKIYWSDQPNNDGTALYGEVARVCNSMISNPTMLDTQREKLFNPVVVKTCRGMIEKINNRTTQEKKDPNAQTSYYLGMLRVADRLKKNLREEANQLINGGADPDLVGKALGTIIEKKLVTKKDEETKLKKEIAEQYTFQPLEKPKYFITAPMSEEENEEELKNLLVQEWEENSNDNKTKKKRKFFYYPKMVKPKQNKKESKGGGGSWWPFGRKD